MEDNLPNISNTQEVQNTNTSFHILTKYQSKVKKICNFLINEEIWQERINELNDKKEYGYALLNLWNMIEATLKLLWYIEHPNDFPDTLDPNKFNLDWEILKNIAQTHSNELKKIFNISDAPKKAGGQSQCLRDLRNSTVHFNKVSPKDKIKEYKNTADSILQLLSKELKSKSEYFEILDTITKK